MALIDQLEESEHSGIGHNNPEPEEVSRSRDIYRRLSSWLVEHPVIDTEEAARLANDELAIGKGMLRELEQADERESKPLYKIWKAAKDRWEKPQTELTTVLDILSERLWAFMLEEEKKRRAEAVRLADEAAEKERLAREAKLAEKDAHLRLKSRFNTRATTLRTKEVLVLTNLPVTIGDMIATDGEISDGLREAILTASRAFRKAHGRLPKGVEAIKEKVL